MASKLERSQLHGSGQLRNESQVEVDFTPGTLVAFSAIQKSGFHPTVFLIKLAPSKNNTLKQTTTTKVLTESDVYFSSLY